MGFFADKLKVVAPEQALPGRSEKMPVPASHFVNGARLEPPFPEGTELALFGLGCFWGAERKFWQTPGVVSTVGRLRRRIDAEPDLPRGVLGADRAHRGGPRRLRSRKRELRRAAARLLGGARSDAGDAPGQRRRHAVPLGDLHLRRRAGAGGRGLARRVPARARSRRARARSRPRSGKRPSSTTPRTTTSSTSRRTRAATAASAAPASPARSGSPRRAPPERRGDADTSAGLNPPRARASVLATGVE